jgi:hypothetical protein
VSYSATKVLRHARKIFAGQIITYCCAGAFGIEIRCRRPVADVVKVQTCDRSGQTAVVCAEGASDRLADPVAGAHYERHLTP